ncbi:MAG: type II toxin-antitoxin system Phd/YefM family antitoxin [Defluviitaleaceae bacterium]|nr:type II toxin-antitoxin system Phd/YefM family antitoxin [Defluviitaleaceae bacterium]
MRSSVQTAEIMRSMVPVSRFNKGEASKIFDEVAKSGMRIAIKNNKPACVLLSPERYESLLEEIEDLELMIEAEKRLKENAPTISFQEVLEKNGITEADLEGWEEVEIE